MDGKGRTGEQDRLDGKAGNVGRGGKLDGKGKAGAQDRLGEKGVVGGALEVIESRNKVTSFFNSAIWSKFF